jgi:hypothetical protein
MQHRVENKWGFHPLRRRALLCPISTRIGAVRVGLSRLPTVAIPPTTICVASMGSPVRTGDGPYRCHQM